jgi:hypothetical protein
MTGEQEAALRANLAATEEALLDATDTIEDVRALCREQIRIWRERNNTWEWIKMQPTWRAFDRMGGS